MVDIVVEAVEDSPLAVKVAFVEPATTAMNRVIRLAIVPKEAKSVTIAIRLDIFPAIVPSPQRVKLVIAAEKQAISPGSVPSRKAVLNRVEECAVPDPIATNVAKLAISRAIAP